jgi:hypothetical protein
VQTFYERKRPCPHGPTQAPDGRVRLEGQARRAGKVEPLMNRESWPGNRAFVEE